MNFFWSNVFEYFKDRHRGAVFLVSLGMFFVALLVGTIIFQIVGADVVREYLNYIWPVVLLLFLLWVGREIRWVRAQRRNRYKISPLSRDERVKARSKLIKSKH